ncbi:MAG: hypothetical protein ISS00_02600 [Candidatus Marinimicrobia bacterium]|nr:hypothetical protein [Candidatus Neomarinimicrobiota bacterium]
MDRLQRYFAVIVLCCIFLFSQTDVAFGKITSDDDDEFTNIGNIQMTITNYGMVGSGFSGLTTETGDPQPSCVYPRDSHIEHLKLGGLWVGGYKGDDVEPHVSTAVIDVYKNSPQSRGYEFTNYNIPGFNFDPPEQIQRKSTLLDHPNFSSKAISHEDLIAYYTDTNDSTAFSTGELIDDHDVPLGISIKQEAYTWNLSFADAFVILKYTIYNVNDDESLNDVYVGFYMDSQIGNTTLTYPYGSNYNWNWYDDALNFSDSLRLAYKYDYDGDNGNTESYFGAMILGTTPFLSLDTWVNGAEMTMSPPVFFKQWYFGSEGLSPGVFRSPMSQDEGGGTTFFDETRAFESYMSTGLNTMAKYNDPNDMNYVGNWREIDEALTDGHSRSMLISTGPFDEIAHGDSIQVVFAVVCGEKWESSPDPMEEDSERNKKNLYTNAFWAQTAYDGEDANHNGELDNGEDINGNGDLDRYILPEPPQAPHVSVIPKDSKVEIFWDNISEISVDPITGEMDFEGYRIYRSRLGDDFIEGNILENMDLIFQADLDNDLGLNTSMDGVFWDVEDDFRYRFVDTDVHNGWQYAYAVTAYDRGNEDIGLEQLESSIFQTLVKVFPGTTPDQAAQTTELGIFPNPYRAGSIWDGTLERERKIYFYNLPNHATVRIFTLSGELVDEFYHDGNEYSGMDIKWFSSFAAGDLQFSGGVHAWDLVSIDDQALATGMYIAHIEDHDDGRHKIGKFVVIK